MLYVRNLIWIKRSTNGVGDVGAGPFRPHFLNNETRLRHVAPRFAKYDLGPTLQGVLLGDFLATHDVSVSPRIRQKVTKKCRRAEPPTLQRAFREEAKPALLKDI